MKKFVSILLLTFIFSIKSDAQSYEMLQDFLEEGRFEELIAVSDSLISGGSSSPYLYQHRGDAYYYLNDIRNALINYTRALEEYQHSEITDPVLEMDCFSNIGGCYDELGINEKALQYHMKHRELAVHYLDTSQFTIGTYNCAISLMEMGRYGEAMPLFLEVYDMDVLLKDTAAIGFDLNALGYVHLEAGFIDKAIEYYQQSIRLLEGSSGTERSLATRWNNLGRAFLDKGNLDSASFFFKASFELHSELMDTINASERLISLGALENKRRNFAKALPFLNSAKVALEKHGVVDQLLQCDLELATSYRGLGEYRKAEELAKKVVRNSFENRSLSSRVNGYSLLSDIYEQTGRWQDALQANKNVQLCRDSLASKETKRALVEMQVRYEVDNMMQENELLKVETQLSIAQLEIAKKERLALWIGIVVLVAGAAAAIVAMYQRQALRRKLYDREVENLKLQVSALVGKADGKAEEISIDLLNAQIESPLSEREFEILASALKGNNNTQIAEELFVSVNTVKFHLKNVYDKLGVSSRNEALQFVIKQS